MRHESREKDRKRVKPDCMNLEINKTNKKKRKMKESRIIFFFLWYDKT